MHDTTQLPVPAAFVYIQTKYQLLEALKNSCELSEKFTNINLESKFFKLIVRLFGSHLRVKALYLYLSVFFRLFVFGFKVLVQIRCFDWLARWLKRRKKDKLKGHKFEQIVELSVSLICQCWGTNLTELVARVFCLLHVACLVLFCLAY